MNKLNLDIIRDYSKLMEDENLTKVKVKDGDFELELEKNRGEVTAAPVVSGNSSASNEQDSTDSNLIEIRAKQVGVFYDQPDVDSEETFKKVGDFVEAGDQVGLISAMKIFTDVKAEQAGTLKEILVSNGETVEYNQVLMLLEPKED